LQDCRIAELRKEGSNCRKRPKVDATGKRSRRTS
jgi:hypothetical protein